MPMLEGDNTLLEEILNQTPYEDSNSPSFQVPVVNPQVRRERLAKVIEQIRASQRRDYRLEAELAKLPWATS